MLSYHQLDTIADAYIPVLLITSLWVLIFHKKALGFKHQLKDLGALVVSILLVYALMFLDNRFQIWPTLSLDYSTHTALSLVFVIYLATKNRPFFALSILSFTLYILLMLYQKYHTLADIVSTTAVLALPIWLLLKRSESSPKP